MESQTARMNPMKTHAVSIRDYDVVQWENVPEELNLLSKFKPDVSMVILVPLTSFRIIKFKTTWPNSTQNNFLIFFPKIHGFLGIYIFSKNTRMLKNLIF